MDDLVTRLGRLDTPWIADAQQGLGVLDAGIRSVVSGKKVVGTAFTVKCYPGSIITVHKALVEARAGDVLVVDGEGDSRAGALMGALMAREAVDRGIAGVVIDGAVRDSADLQTVGLPVFARQVTPRVGVNRRLGCTQVPVTVGGVIVHPGDYILGDDDGVVVIPASQIETVIEAAEAIQVKEQRIAEAIARHERVADILNLRPLFEASK